MIEGNATAILQVRAGTTKNGIGEKEAKWVDVIELTGWIDLQAGDSKRITYNAKIQESTHIFIGDYKPIPATVEIEGKIVKVNAESTRIVANAEKYDVMLIDDPMGLHAQWEIYLKYTGGQ